MGAFVAAVAALKLGSPVEAFLLAGCFGALFATIYAVMVIHGRADQIVAGTAMNLLAVGLIPLLLKFLYNSTGGTPSLEQAQKFSHFPLWFAWIMVATIWAVLKLFPFGLWVSFAGENPEALDAAGVSVNRTRYFAVALSGLLAGWGGASLSIFMASGYSRNMVAGRGFMALAALILGRWRPVPAALACLFFGAMEAGQIRLQYLSEYGIPVQIMQIIPYLATLAVLAGFAGRTGVPKAIGTVFEKG